MLFVVGGGYDSAMDYDRGSGPYRDGEPMGPGSRYQKVENESWPLRDKNGFHARGIKTRDYTIPVTVRLVFKRDGETFLEGRADRWTKTHVHVSLVDPRLQVDGVWVRAGDVKRR